jgi:hypothetical protein
MQDYLQMGMIHLKIQDIYYIHILMDQHKQVTILLLLDHQIMSRLDHQLQNLDEEMQQLQIQVV